MYPISCVVFVCGLFNYSIGSPYCVIGTSSHRITVQDELGRTWKVTLLSWFVVVSQSLTGKTVEEMF